jgi:hypothetical protein
MTRKVHAPWRLGLFVVLVPIGWIAGTNRDPALSNGVRLPARFDLFCHHRSIRDKSQYRCADVKHRDFEPPDFCDSDVGECVRANLASPRFDFRHRNFKFQRPGV